MLTKIRLSLLSLWLGVMAFFSFVVAPSAFAALPETNLAGLVVSTVLARVELIGIVLGVIALLVLLASSEQTGKQFLFELITLILMTFSMILSRFVISRRLHEIRVKFGGTNLIPSTDPSRATFDQLHQLSVGLTSFVMIAAAVLIVVLVRRKISSRY
ncbi:MAG: DUF4149 domain-containing protein [Blastocatellia bacterium]